MVLIPSLKIIYSRGPNSLVETPLEVLIPSLRPMLPLQVLICLEVPSPLRSWFLLQRCLWFQSSFLSQRYVSPQRLTPFLRCPSSWSLDSLLEKDAGLTRHIVSIQSTFEPYLELTLLGRTHETFSLEGLMLELWPFKMFLDSGWCARLMGYFSRVGAIYGSFRNSILISSPIWFSVLCYWSLELIGHYNTLRR